MLSGLRPEARVPSCSPRCTEPGSPPAALAHRQRFSQQRPRRGVRLHAKTQNKEFRPPRWEFVYGDLTDKRNLETLDPREAWEKMELGKLVLVDVRPKNRHEEAHPPGSVNAQLYRKTDFSQFSFQRYFRAAALMANGIEAVEPNPNFMSELTAASGGKPICLMCETGGTLSATSSFPTGKVSRSLLAAYQAFELGSFPGVFHLRGGALGWSRSRLPFEGEYNPGGAGRTPNVVSNDDLGEDERDAVSTIRNVQSD